MGADPVEWRRTECLLVGFRVHAAAAHGGPNLGALANSFVEEMERVCGKVKDAVIAAGIFMCLGLRESKSLVPRRRTPESDALLVKNLFGIACSARMGKQASDGEPRLIGRN